MCDRIESNRIESKCSYPLRVSYSPFLFLRTYSISLHQGLELIGVKFHEHDTEGTGFLTAVQLCTAFTPICAALDVPVPDTERITTRLAELQTEKAGHVNLLEMIFVFGYLKVMIICTRTLYGYIYIYIYIYIFTLCIIIAL